MRSTLAQVTLDLFAEDAEAYHDEEYCRNCLEVVHTPDDRTGLIHKHGKYRCFTYNDSGKAIPLSTVAERKN